MCTAPTRQEPASSISSFHMLYIKIVEKRVSEWVIPDFILKCDESDALYTPDWCGDGQWGNPCYFWHPWFHCINVLFSLPHHIIRFRLFTIGWDFGLHLEPIYSNTFFLKFWVEAEEASFEMQASFPAFFLRAMLCTIYRCTESHLVEKNYLRPWLLVRMRPWFPAGLLNRPPGRPYSNKRSSSINFNDFPSPKNVFSGTV